MTKNNLGIPFIHIKNMNYIHLGGLLGELKQDILMAG